MGYYGLPGTVSRVQEAQRQLGRAHSFSSRSLTEGGSEARAGHVPEDRGSGLRSLQRRDCYTTRRQPSPPALRAFSAREERGTRQRSLERRDSYTTVGCQRAAAPLAAIAFCFLLSTFCFSSAGWPRRGNWCKSVQFGGSTPLHNKFQLVAKILSAVWRNQVQLAAVFRRGRTFPEAGTFLLATLGLA